MHCLIQSPSNLTKQLLSYLCFMEAAARLSETKQFALSHTAKWGNKILISSAISWGGGRGRSKGQEQCLNQARAGDSEGIGVAVGKF